MLIPRPTLAALARRLRALPPGMRIADAEVDIDPLDLARSGADAFGHAAFYSSPDGTAIGTLGTAHRVSASGPRRLETLDAALSLLDPGTPAMVGFAFDAEGPGADWEGFPSATLVVPEVAVIRSGGRSRLVIVLPPGAEGHLLLTLAATLKAPPAGSEAEGTGQIEERPPAEDWTGLVDEAVAAIGAGTLDKVVLARSVVVEAPSPYGAFDLVARLRDRHPDSRVFGWQEGDAAFVGASPELLVAREDHQFHLAPLAGSTARGADPDEDRRLGDGLLASAKDRREHALVVEDAVERLRPLAGTLEHAPNPVLHRFATVQHLATPIHGTTDASLLALAAAIHPTPAVGGTPRADALAFIEKTEGIDRGWYSGGIGWTDPSGTGELAIALRCALIRGSKAVAYAGNGIVAESVAEDELEETRLKLRTMIDLLG